MNLQNPPEIADGGYWYVVPLVIDEDGGKTPGEMIGVGWCAWYAGGQVVIRCPEPVASVQTSEASAMDILSQAGYSIRPYGRIEGR